ncbi:MAG: hypothetical protein AAFV53_06030 [Myxococcota bacterium]
MSGSSSTTAELKAVGLSTAAWWCVGGTVLLLVDAIVRLTPIALEPILAGELTVATGAVYLLSMAFMAYAEGYRGFQLQFSPRLAARARVIDQTPWWVRALAPLYGMGMIYAPRRRLIASWLLVFGIVLMIVMIRYLPQPWRGAVDAGVVVGLTWGALSVMVETARAWGGQPASVEPELPTRR